MNEVKVICGIKHVKVPCIRCQGLVWVSAVRANLDRKGRLPYVCDTCAGRMAIAPQRRLPLKIKGPNGSFDNAVRVLENY